jgi:hypothetical protein
MGFELMAAEGSPKKATVVFQTSDINDVGAG